MSYQTDYFNIPRKSKDRSYNRFGISLLNLCCSFNVHTLNGRLVGDTDGNFTCIANNGASVVDYIICSSEIFSYVSDFRVLENDSSDHFPLHCTFLFKSKKDSHLNQSQSKADGTKYVRFKWNDRFKDDFYHKFTVSMATFNEKLSENSSQQTIPLLKDFNHIIQEAAGKMLYKPKSH